MKFDDKLTEEIIPLKQQKCIALDKLFVGNNKLKTNTVWQMRDAEWGIKRYKRDYHEQR